MMGSFRRLIFLVALVAGCATTNTAPYGPGEEARPARPAAQRKGEETAPKYTGPMGTLYLEVTDPEGIPVRSRVELQDAPGHIVYVTDVPQGRLQVKAPVGTYTAYLQAYELGAPYTVDVRPVEIVEDTPTVLATVLVEGRTASMLTLKALDLDRDLATFNAELSAGTDPADVLSVPGRTKIAYTNKVLNPSAGWYAGDLAVHSHYGRGSESVAELVRRAEQRGLDFLAIADANTLAAMDDPGFTSESVVLIPALAWGNDDRGYGIIYGPGTVPVPPSSLAAAQSVCGLAQSQGGVFAVAHPCHSRAPWQWGLAFVNSVQVWCGPWRGTPPMRFEQLKEGVRLVNKENELVHSIAIAAKSAELSAAQAQSPAILEDLKASPSDAEHLVMSANMQAELFYDTELNRGLIAAVFGGSDSTGPKQPLGEPVTYVYAREKSLAGIMEGLRLGHTYISRSLDGPKILFQASFLKADGTLDDTKPRIGVGGYLPLDTYVRFEVVVTGAEGLKLEVLRDGKPDKLKRIEGKNILFKWEERMAFMGNYRVRVVGPPLNLRAGYGAREVHAMTSPIFIRSIYYERPAEPSEG